MSSKPKNLISASLMCADLGNLEREIKKLERAGIDFFHIDIMDGHFVPNLTFGPDLVKKVKELTKLPLDIHLMVENPEKHIDLWQTKKDDLISFHIETTDHPGRVIQQIKARNSRAGIALNPATPLNSIAYLLQGLDFVLLMTVNPGFAGQKWIPAVSDKVKKLSQILHDKNLKIEIQVDGNIGKHNIPLLKNAGADIFVGGSSSVFADSNYFRNAQKMRRLLNEK